MVFKLSFFSRWRSSAILDFQKVKFLLRSRCTHIGTQTTRYVKSRVGIARIQQCWRCRPEAIRKKLACKPKYCINFGYGLYTKRPATRKTFSRRHGISIIGSTSRSITALIIRILSWKPRRKLTARLTSSAIRCSQFVHRAVCRPFDQRPENLHRSNVITRRGELVRYSSALDSTNEVTPRLARLVLGSVIDWVIVFARQTISVCNQLPGPSQPCHPSVDGQNEQLVQYSSLFTIMVADR